MSTTTKKKVTPKKVTKTAAAPVKKVPFSKLSKAGKRVAIAEDVILQIKAKRFVIELGKYFSGEAYSKIYNLSFVGEEKEKELQKILQNNTCEVCAKGALFAADILRNNKFKLSNTSNVDYNTIMERLENIFTLDQLNLIETAFEKDVITDVNNFLKEYNQDEDGNKIMIYNPIAKKAIKFGNKYIDDEKRCIAIMKNIVKNNGKFQP